MSHTVSKAGSLPDEVTREIEHGLSKFPPERKQSAVIAALRAAQHHNGGFLTHELIEAVAHYLGLPPVHALEVATFYSMFEIGPRGRHHISVCDNISCMLCGAGAILAHIEKRLGIRPGESTADGKFFLKREEECLAACTGAPMMMVDHVYYENLTPERVDEILDSLE